MRRRSPSRLVIDPVTAVLSSSSSDEARAILRTSLFKLTKEPGITTYLIAELPYGQEMIGFGFEEFLADVLIKLRVESKRGLTKRKLIVFKAREVPLPIHEFEYVIGRD